LALTLTLGLDTCHMQAKTSRTTDTQDMLLRKCTPEKRYYLAVFFLDDQYAIFSPKYCSEAMHLATSTDYVALVHYRLCHSCPL